MLGDFQSPNPLHKQGKKSSTELFFRGAAAQLQQSLQPAVFVGLKRIRKGIFSPFSQYLYIGDIMKKKLSVIFLSMVLAFSLNGCSKDSFMDISAFTDYYNEVTSFNRIDLSEYLIRDGVYSLLLENEEEELLLTLETVDEGKIDEIRMLIPKVTDDGGEKPVTESGRSFFADRLTEVLKAYTLFTFEECEQIVTDMKLRELSSFNSMGELTMTKGDWHMVYYSTQVACVFMIFNIHLHPIEKTEKPQSKPAFGNTAYTREEKIRST